MAANADQKGLVVTKNKGEEDAGQTEHAAEEITVKQQEIKTEEFESKRRDETNRKRRREMVAACYLSTRSTKSIKEEKAMVEDPNEETKKELPQEQQRLQQQQKVKSKKEKSVFIAIPPAHLQSFKGATVPDLLPLVSSPFFSSSSSSSVRLKLLFVGINPGLRSAAVQAHFAGASNRFYPALHESGLTCLPTGAIYAVNGYTKAARIHLQEQGLGITNFVSAATQAESDIPVADFSAGVADLERKVKAWRPAVVVILGIGAYTKAYKITTSQAAQRNLQRGPLPSEYAIGGRETWLLGNPSGLNGRQTVADHAQWFRQVKARAEEVLLAEEQQLGASELSPKTKKTF